MFDCFLLPQFLPDPPHLLTCVTAYSFFPVSLKQQTSNKKEIYKNDKKTKTEMKIYKQKINKIKYKPYKE